jgi:hypothetical protein
MQSCWRIWWCLGVSSLIAAGAAPPELEPGPAVDYGPLAFQPEVWEKKGTSTMLLPWEGDQVVFLTTAGEYDRRLLARWVKRLDEAWVLYASLTGAEPGRLKELKGKPTLAAVPSDEYTCGAGCGYLGLTGIELAMFYDWNYPALQRNADTMPHYVFYEMGRNFYTFGDRHSCFTTGFAVFMRYVCMDALGCHDDDLATRQVIERAESLVAKSDMPFLRMFTDADGLHEKAPRLKDEQGRWVHPSDQPVTYASAMLRLRSEYGGDDWVRRFFRALATAPTAPPHTLPGARRQSWSWLICASLAAGKDLTPLFVDEWRMPLAPGTRTELAALDWQASVLDFAWVAERVQPHWQ